MGKSLGLKSGSLFLAACLITNTVIAEIVTNKDTKVNHFPNKVIIFVWDGLRPDSVTKTLTPHLANFRKNGVNFIDNHSMFPTFTMMNASSFSTGNYVAAHGFYGNTLYQPGPQGKDSAGKNLDFNQPIYVEDYRVVNALTSYYDGDLFLVRSLFQVAQQAGLTTAAVGKTGAAFIQDYANYAKDPIHGNGQGIMLDEKFAFPLSFVKELEKAGYLLPNLTHVNYHDDSLFHNEDPTKANSAAIITLADKKTKDPRSEAGSPYNNVNEYLMKVYLEYILPQKNPDLSVIWLRNPDATEHEYGPGSKPYVDALRNQDKLLGALLAKLKTLKIEKNTNIIIVSDHGHSTVAGGAKYFPPRLLKGDADGTGTVGEIDHKQGFSVSGDVRTADLLTRSGIAHVYDGAGCTFNPVLSGIKKDGSTLYPELEDKDGNICGKPMKYTTPSYKVPTELPKNATIIATNGGSEYIYLPDHDPQRLKAIIRVLQSRKQYGALFIADRYGNISGTMPMSVVKIGENSRSPDLIVSFDFDENAYTVVNKSVPGIEYESAFNLRGMHGSFSPRDIHNSLFAFGPDFKTKYINICPSGSVDVAPTVAYILGLSMPGVDGRILLESLKEGGKNCTSAQVKVIKKQSTEVAGLKILNPDDLDGTKIDHAKSKYRFILYSKKLYAPDGKTYIYFDKAKAVRH